MIRPVAKAFGGCLILAATIWSDGNARADEAPGVIKFESHIAPLLETRCLRCHGEGKLEAGLNVRRRSTLLAGGDSGASLVPGKPDESILLQRIEKGEMPPKDEEPLTEPQKKLIRQWIANGAPLVAAQEPPLDENDMPSRLSDEDRRFWSFRPPVRPSLPLVRQIERLRTPIDALVAAPLEARQLQFNDDATKSTVLRRVSLDLIGLNPTLDELDAFLADDGPDAYERVVDRLLASPLYGERWGRHWLDIAGYADSDGYLAADRLRPQAWRYRDYVVQALNADLPYDQFVREQLAGDELSDWRAADELTPETTRRLAATGFLRTASDPTYPGYTEPNEIHQVMSDTMQIVGSTFLGLTVQCARCHAHKFDPFSQRDYYSLQAIFLPALDPARWQPSEVRGIPLATDAQTASIVQKNQQADQRIGELNKALGELTTRFRQKRVHDALAGITNPIRDSFDGDKLDPAWLVQLSGTAKSWKHEVSGGVLTASSIDGQPGYALVRLVRPVIVEGEFETSLRFQWRSPDGPAEKNEAMQGILLNLRDAQGNVVASAGYLDENNSARGSPITGISTAQDPLGPDVVAHHVKQYKQAVPPNEKARALAASGTATVTLRRNSAGQVTATFDDGRIRDELTGANSTPVTSVEIEFRRFILTPGATFEGVSADDVQFAPGPTAALAPEKVAQLAAAILAPEKQRSEEQKQLVARLAPAVPTAENDLAAAYAEYRDESTKLKNDVAAQTAQKRDIPKIRGLMDVEGPLPQAHILRRGDYGKPGGVVEPGVPEVLANASTALAATPVGKSSGRRRAFAEWLVRPDHPLTARVEVNRIWAKLFGRGIVATPANFGRSGVAPTHPELLDWLAVELPRQAWSVKSLQRQLVTSTTYRQSSALTPTQATIDPKNQWLSAFSPRRFEGEIVRDNSLFVAGKLNTTQGGAPSQLAPQGDGSVLTADDAAGNRRAIYLIVRRSQHLTMLDLFDVPAMEVNCPERNTSTVPLQALALLHGPFSQQAAAALGERLWNSAVDDDARVEFAFRLLFSRVPRDADRSNVREFLAAAARDALGGREPAPGDAAAEAARRTAWKELALTLLNSNEFLYVP